MLLKLSLSLVSVYAVMADGEAANELCRSAVGPASYCRSDNKTCHGLNPQGRTVECGNVFDAPEDHTPSTSTTTTTTTGRPLTVDSSLRASPASARSVMSHSDGMFLWVEFPEQISDESEGGVEYYKQLLQFTNSNSAGIHVNRLILRVMNPNYGSAMWQISTDSIFVREFLNKVRPDIDLRIYPYMDSEYCPKWVRDMGKPNCLEAAFAYTEQFNEFLQTHRPEIRFNGVVTDLEESERCNGGFHLHFNLLHDLKRRYGLTFGTSVGYTRTAKRDWAQESIHLFSHVDEMYIQMYDWQHITNETHVASGSDEFINNPDSFIRKLTTEVIRPHWYTSEKLQFMWAVQSRDAQNCLYPLTARRSSDTLTCGATEQFGKWRPEKFLEFLVKAKRTIPGFAGKAHGINEFDLMPRAWF